MAAKLRYLFQIKFYTKYGWPIESWDISEPMKSIQEVEEYKTIIDHTVIKWQVVDQVTNRIIDASGNVNQINLNHGT